MTRLAILTALAIACSGCINEADRAQGVWTLCRDEVLRQDPKAKLATYDASHVRKTEVRPSYLPQNPGHRGYQVQILVLRAAGDTRDVVEGDWLYDTDGTTAEVGPAIIIDRFPPSEPPADVLRRMDAQ
jgi:hypothetical protein